MKVLVLGGGASGMAAAITAAKNGHDVTILEKNKVLGKKVLITGNGRCNYFNSDFDNTKYFTDEEDNLKEIINEKNKKELLNFFDIIGIVPNVIEGYYYPYSNQAITFNYCLINTINSLNIKTILEAEVKKIEKENNIFTVHYNNNVIKADAIILSMGSKCYPKTGSTGDSYKFLKELGHTINTPYPALVGLNTNDKITKLSGVRCNAKASLFINNKKIYTESGQLQINSDGISGICILNMSGIAVRNLENDVAIKINFLANLDIDKNSFISFLDQISNKTAKRKLYSILEGILNYKLIDYVFDILKLNKEKNYKDFNEDALNKLGELLTNYEIKITGFKGFDNAQTSGGGVPLKEVNPNTMESLIINNLYITGEVLDVYGMCGGYNLSFCFLTGIIAGKSI